MEYRALGRSGVKVSPLCLGTMNFGDPTGEEESIRVIHAALDAGINFVDTANVYNHGVSEEIVGKALQGRRHQVVLATKVHGKMGVGPNDYGNSRYHIMQQVEDSLRRLRTDHIDLYQLHRPDPETPLDEQLGALTDLVRQGKVRYIGSSTFPAWQLCESLCVSERRLLERFICEQPPYSLLNRRIETETLPFCRAHGFAVIPWSPLAGGWLTGKYQKGQAAPGDSRAHGSSWDLQSDEARRRFDAVEKLLPLAKEAGVSLLQFSLAWLLANPAVTAPIIGPRNMRQLEENLPAAHLSLDAALLKKVDAAVAPGGNLMNY